MTVRLLAVLMSLILIPAARGAEPTATITAREIQAHVNFLASDLLQGRDSGHLGAEVAALYVATHLARCGFKPLADDWQIPFELPGAAGPGQALLAFGERVLNDPARVAVWGFSGTGKVSGEAASGGAADSNGKIVIAPGGQSSDTDLEQARGFVERGAVAVLFVTDNDEFQVRRRPDGRRMTGPPRRDRRNGDNGVQGGYLEPKGAFAKLSSGETLQVPVARVTRLLGAELLEAVEGGASVSLEITRDGVDQSTNVVGWLEGSDPELKHEYVLVGAHYDHVGADDLGQIWNGADDNASGTSAVLEFADALHSMDRAPRRSIVLAAWGAEERGLVGSKAFVRDCPIPLQQVAAYMNLDMISRNDPGFVDVVHSSDDLLEMMRASAGRHELEVNEGQAFYLNASDTAAFVENEVPCVFPFTDIHADYHRPTDDPDRIDADKAMRVARSAFDVVLQVANADERPAFTAPARDSRRGGARSRRLGFRPKGGAEEAGIAVEQVSPGSVAETAGLLPGDVLMRVGQSPVTNSGELRRALASQTRNQPFELEVLRDGQPVVLQATFDK